MKDMFHQGGEKMHTWIKDINGTKVFYWSLGNVYYIKDKQGNWICENKNLNIVEYFIKTI
ncbi:hypothetical protein D3C87_624330 [compost metagenome]